MIIQEFVNFQQWFGNSNKNTSKPEIFCTKLMLVVINVAFNKKNEIIISLFDKWDVSSFTTVEAWYQIYKKINLNIREQKFNTGGWMLSNEWLFFSSLFATCFSKNTNFFLSNNTSSSGVIFSNWVAGERKEIEKKRKKELNKSQK